MGGIRIGTAGSSSIGAGRRLTAGKAARLIVAKVHARKGMAHLRAMRRSHGAAEGAGSTSMYRPAAEAGCRSGKSGSTDEPCAKYSGGLDPPCGQRQ